MSVKVAVRSRPVNKDEMDSGASIILRMNGNHVEVIDSSQGKGAKFLFDAALWSTNAAVAGNKNPLATQKDVYTAIGSDILGHTFTGYNACIFAYGQTGSGKTYSMMGRQGEEGIVPQVAAHIFEQAQQKVKEGTEVCIEVSYLEIYNEHVRCLLNPTEVGFEGSKLRVREHPATGPYVEGLARFVVSSKEQFLGLMADGNSLRTTGATAMNATSSRSHAVFTIIVTQKTKKGPLITTKISKLNLVDLAGSERASKTHATGKTLQEGSNINKSLTSLGNVISSLAEEFESGKGRHVPYRDSTLTWILKENLGGNSKTVMLATVSPASIHFEETMSTLRYAERAKKVQNKAVVNESNNSEVIAALQKEIEALRSQLRSAGDAASKERISDELSLNESVARQLEMSLAEKLAETDKQMKEREAHMKEMEEQLSRQGSEIRSLRLRNSEKDAKINALLQQIVERETRDSGRAAQTEKISDEIERLRLQIAELEIQQDEEEAERAKAAKKAQAAAVLRAQDLGNVQVEGVGGKVSVKALAKAFEQHTHAPAAKQHVVEVNKLPAALLQKSAAQPTPVKQAPAAAASSTAAPEADDDIDIADDLDIADDDNILENLDDDIQLDEPEMNLDDDDAADEIDLDDEEAATNDVKAEDDVQLDDDEVKLEDDDADNIQLDDDDIEIDDDKPAAAGAAASPIKAEDMHQETDDVELDESEAVTIEDEPAPPAPAAAEAAPAAETAPTAPKPSVPIDVAQRRARAQTVTARAGEKESKPNILPPAESITTLNVPSHTLPNNRFLREPFKVLKVDETALIGGKKERIWDVDFFGKKFSNLDMTGYESFSQPADKLFRVEKDVVNSKKLTLYFFEAPHAYDLVFTSTERRQRFYELAMLQRRNSIMWCPSLCVEGENDVVLNIQGSTIERGSGKVVKAKGDVKFVIARMPYEVIDLWYGCFSMQEKPLPRSAAVLGSFLPKAQHEVYVIAVSDVPSVLMGTDDIGNYFLQYLGTAMYFLLANSAAETKSKNASNIILVIVRRSFIVRTTHIEATDVTPVRKEGGGKADFTAVGAALRINESSIGILMINCHPSIGDPAVRAGCIRGLMSNFPFGDQSVDVGVRFDYLVVSGNFGFKDDFKENDMLIKQMKAGNVISDFSEAEPHSSLLSTPNPMRILYYCRPRTCRFDVKQYQTSRAMAVPNAYITCDVFCQRAFLSTFGEQVPRTQFIFNTINVIGQRIPHINNPELQISSEFVDGSPISLPLSKTQETYSATGKAVPPVNPVVSNQEFLRLQSITFSLFGVLPASKDKRRMVLASGVLPLKNMISLGESVDFSIPLYYRGCNVGSLTGTILQVHTEKNNEMEMASLGVQASERDAIIIACHENQVLTEQGTWVPSLATDGTPDWSSVKDPTVQARRESFELPDPAKWKWLTQWRHEARADNAEGWMYANSFKDVFEQRKSKTHKARRRRWTRVLQAADALTLHNYLSETK
jgi:hypothetical protein